MLPTMSEVSVLTLLLSFNDLPSTTTSVNVYKYFLNTRPFESHESKAILFTSSPRDGNGLTYVTS